LKGAEEWKEIGSSGINGSVGQKRTQISLKELRPSNPTQNVMAFDTNLRKKNISDCVTLLLVMADANNKSLRRCRGPTQKIDAKSPFSCSEWCWGL
jgi:hypothetical protein